jgi:hypothetical protein
VVSDRLVVAQTHQVARIVYNPDAESRFDDCGLTNTLLQTIDVQGCKAYYDMSGRPTSVASTKDPVPVVVEAPPAPARAEDADPAGGKPAAKPPTGKEPVVPPSSAPSTITFTVGLDGKPVVKAAPKSPSAVDRLTVVYLPDFEEQMVVKHENVLAHGKFAIAFRDGWELKSVGGSFDATDVPVQILNTVRNAISAAGAVEEKRAGGGGAGTNPAPAAGGAGKAGVARSTDEMVHAFVVITRTLYIDPGIYRLQKAAERDGEPPTGHGLLLNLGIPAHEEIQVQLPPRKKTPAADAKQGAVQKEELPAPRRAPDAAPK